MILNFPSFCSQLAYNKKISMLFLYAADDEHLSRLDPTLLSDQALLEIFVSSFKNISEFQDENGNFLDIAEWENVDMGAQDGHDTTVAYFTYPVADEQPNLGGSLNLVFLPPTLEGLYIVSCDLTGTIETADLPRGLLELNVCLNKLEGSFSIEKLPSTLEILIISGNQLCGSLRIGALPRPMRTIQAIQNMFVGEIDLRSLPPGLQRIEIDNNKFSGSVIVGPLPETLNIVKIGMNGALTMDMPHLPASLTGFFVSTPR